MAGVSVTLLLAPRFPPGVLVAAFERRVLEARPDEAPPLALATAAVTMGTSGLVTFTGLKANTRYSAGAEIDGHWHYCGFHTGGVDELSERARAEAREAELRAELIGIVPGEEGVEPPVLAEGGRVMAWGEANSSDFGENANLGASLVAVPQEVPGAVDIVKVCGGQHFQLYIDGAGLVQHVGGSTFGQSGDGTGIDKGNVHPVIIPAGELPVDISGHSNPVVLCQSGRVLAWGGNTGQLGIGGDGIRATARWRPSYVEVKEGERIQDVHRIYSAHQCAYYIMGDGSLKACGPIGDMDESLDPLSESNTRYFAEDVHGGLTGIDEVAGGKEFCIVRKGTTALVKGANNYGQHGDGTFDTKLSANAEWVEPNLPGPVKEVACSEYDLGVLLTDGTIRLWGRNHRGQCGNGYQDALTAKPTVTADGGGAILARIDDGTDAALAAGNVMTVSSGASLVRVGSVILGTGLDHDPEVITKLSSLTFVVNGAAAKVGSVASPASLTATSNYVVTWSAEPGQTTYEVGWRAKWAVPSTITASIAPVVPGEPTVKKSILTVTAGNDKVKLDCPVEGTGVANATKVIRSLGGNKWEVSKYQTVSSRSMTVSAPEYTLGNTSIELFGVLTYTIEGWGEAEAPEVHVQGAAHVLTPFDPGLTGITQLYLAGGEQSGGEAGDWFFLALKDDDTIWGCGGNKHGELGRGDTVQQLSPVQCALGTKDVLYIGGSEGEVGAICKGVPTHTPRFTATPVPASKDVKVDWNPPADCAVTGWKLEWRRLEGDPSSNNKQEAFKKDKQGGVSSLLMPATTTSHTIKGAADTNTPNAGDVNPGLPLPLTNPTGWAKPTNMLEIKLVGIFNPNSGTGISKAKVSGRRWAVKWTDANGPAATVFDGEGGSEPKTDKEPGYIVKYRFDPSESFTDRKSEEVPANSESAGKGVLVIDDVPDAATLEVELEGTGSSGTNQARYWGSRIIEAIPNLMPEEVPWLITTPHVGIVPFGTAAEPDPMLKPKCNVVVLYPPGPAEQRNYLLVGGTPGNWGAQWTDVLNAKGEKEPGWYVRYKTVDKAGWQEAGNGGGLSPLLPPGDGVSGGTYTITTSAKPEVRVEGSRGGGTTLGDLITAIPGTWGGQPITSRAYQWFRQYHSEGNPDPISGATGASYRVTTADAGYAITVEERPSNLIGPVNASAGNIGNRFIGEPSHKVVGD